MNAGEQVKQQLVRHSLKCREDRAAGQEHERDDDPAQRLATAPIFLVGVPVTGQGGDGINVAWQQIDGYLWPAHPKTGMTRKFIRPTHSAIGPLRAAQSRC